MPDHVDYDQHCGMFAKSKRLPTLVVFEEVGMWFGTFATDGHMAFSI